MEKEEKIYDVNIEDTNIIPIPKESRKIIQQDKAQEHTYKKYNYSKIILYTIIFIILIIIITCVIYKVIK